VPAGDDRNRHQERGQDHEGQRNPVHAHLVADLAAKPRIVLDKLEAGIAAIEAGDQKDRNRKRDERGPERNPTRIAVGRFVVAAQDHNE
jgi:hypothetical protein